MYQRCHLQGEEGQDEGGEESGSYVPDLGPFSALVGQGTSKSNFPTLLFKGRGRQRWLWGHVSSTN